MMLRKFLILLLCSAPLFAHASGAAKLKTFISATRSAQSDFIQEVLDRNGHLLQLMTGSMQFVRPDRFRWSYEKPYEQLIVGDGKKFWLYDVDLNQVTVKAQGNALGSSPAALLSGSNQIERGFDLRDISCEEAHDIAQAASAPVASSNDAPICKDGKDIEGLEWLEAIPKSRESSIEKIRMALNDKSDLVVMELLDTFGHKTVLHFTNLKRNPALASHLFKFEPPKGADILDND